MATTRSQSAKASAYGSDSVDPEEETQEVESEETPKDRDAERAREADESTSDEDENVLLGYEPSLLMLKETVTLRTTKCQLLFKGNKEQWNDFKWSFRAFLRNSSDGVYLPTQLIDYPMEQVLREIEATLLPYLEQQTEKEQKRIKSRVQARVMKDRKSIVLIMMNIIQGTAPTLLRGCSPDDCCEMWQTISKEYEDLGDFAVVTAFRGLTNFKAPLNMPVSKVFRHYDDAFRLLAEQGRLSRIV